MSTAPGSAPALRIQLLESLDALAPYAAAWHALLETAIPGRGFFYRLPMLRAMAPVHAAPDHPGGRRSPFFLLAWRGEQLVGGLPLVLERKPWSRAGVRRLLLWGGDGGALGLEGDIPLAGEALEQRAIAEALISALRTTLRARFDRLDLGLLREDSPSLAVVRRALPDAHWTASAMASHVLQLDGGIDAWRASRSGSRLRELGRLGRRLAAAHVIAWEEPAQLTVEQESRVVSLHRARQEALRERGWRRDTVFERDAYRAALQTLLREAAGECRTRHLLLLADGEIIGFLLGFRDGDTVLAFLTAVDAAFLPFGPGGVLFREYVERAFATGDIRRIEFGVGTTFVKETMASTALTPAACRWDPRGAPLGAFRRAAYDRLIAIRDARAAR